MNLENLVGPSMAVHWLYLALILWSIRFPQRRVWPPTQARSWKFALSWGLFLLAVAADLAFLLRGGLRDPATRPGRWAVALALSAVGLFFLGWGIQTLGLLKTLGLRGTFVAAGPYRFTRNPQYLGDIFLLAGLMVVAQAAPARAGLALLLVAFLLMPLAEEPWLEEHYGEAYRRYKHTTPRFL
ncbi:MAG: DUF1295 domain-containing protein [Chloroflexi bacterium]|nr:DUF1295 domain-containing protein [Chloroflexota bacterium]